MMQNIDKLNDRQYKALIGLNKERFNQLTVLFKECELQINEEYYQKFVEYYNRKPSSGGNPTFKQPAEKLFFVLYYLKNYPTFDVLGFCFDCSGKTAHQNLYKYLPILIMALDKLNCLPKRCFENAIGGIRRYAILQNKFRNKSVSLRYLAIFIAAGLWNFFKGFSFS